MPAHPYEPFSQRGVAGRDEPGKRVGVAGEVLRGALPGEVCAEVERALQERRGERVVAAEQGAARMRGLRGLRDVRDGERRVRGCLDDRQGGSVTGAAEAVGVAQVIAANVDSEARRAPRSPASSTS